MGASVNLFRAAAKRRGGGREGCSQSEHEPGVRRESDMTQLHAAAMQNDSPAVGGALLKAGAAPNVRSENDRMPFYTAAEHTNPPISSALLEGDSPRNLVKPDGRHATGKVAPFSLPEATGTIRLPRGGLLAMILFAMTH